MDTVWILCSCIFVEPEPSQLEIPAHLQKTHKSEKVAEGLRAPFGGFLK